jgi:hypothetical protein
VRQIGGTYEVIEGALMNGDECVTLQHRRVIVEPLSQQPIVPRIEVKVEARKKNRWERAADNLATFALASFALYLVYIVAYAFYSGAFARAVGQ